MRLTTLQRWQISEILISLFVFFIIFSYTYALLVLAPSPGFAFNNTNGLIVEIYTQPEQGLPTLQIGDVIKKIGPISWETYQADNRVLLFEGVEAGEVIEITVNRNGESILVPWKFTGLNQNILNTRLVNIWVLSFLFFFVGAIALALMRPRDLLRNLFVAINYLTALWLIFGMLSHSHIWLSSILLHASTWLLLPVYLHFHWIFPRPLKQLPKSIVILIYFICSCFVIAEIFEVLHKSLYAFAFLLALLGSFIIQVIHYRKHQDQRQDIRLLAIAIAIAFLPAIVLGIFAASGSVPGIAPLALFALPFMPLAYFYVIYRRRMGGLEIRLNRIISIYLFLILFGIALFIIAILFVNLNLPVEHIVIARIIIVLAFVFTSITTFSAFQKFIERRFLGIKLDYQNLQEAYASRIITSTSIASLLQLLEEEVFPSLLIRQYAFMQTTDGNLKALLIKNVSASELPDETKSNYLLERSGKFIPDISSDDWIRLILPLQVGDSTLGFWLLGQRDPDDLYHQQEIPALQSIANQTAIALSNILHEDLLKQMYQSGIERYEQERLRLAHELHDSVLNELGDLRRNLGKNLSPTTEASYKEVTDRLREIVNDLRPPMLIYGLAPAISALAENLMQKTGDTVKIVVNIQTTDERMSENIEIHLFRIVQEACKNSLRHAQANTIKISGSLTPQKADLLIEDDGTGFELTEHSGLGNILANHHFGLAGIMERAHIIRAKPKIESKPSIGTKIQISWIAEEIN